MEVEKLNVDKTSMKLIELKIAKANVSWLLENDGLVDMHGLVYWAGVVERLRQEVRQAI